MELWKLQDSLTVISVACVSENIEM